MLNDLEVTTEDKGIIIHYSFEVSKNSPPVRDITWSKNAQPMYIKDDKFSGGSLHDIRLVIISPSEDDKGNYSCTVTNDVGSETKYIVLGKFVLIMVVLYDYYLILFLCSPLFLLRISALLISSSELKRYNIIYIPNLKQEQRTLALLYFVCRRSLCRNFNRANSPFCIRYYNYVHCYINATT